MSAEIDYSHEEGVRLLSDSRLLKITALILAKFAAVGRWKECEKGQALKISWREAHFRHSCDHGSFSRQLEGKSDVNFIRLCDITVYLRSEERVSSCKLISI